VIVVTLAAMAAVAGPTAAQAQTLPRITSFGPDFPKTGIFIGNSFFYYNNGPTGSFVADGKGRRPRKQERLPQHHGDDRRFRLRLA